MKAVVSAMWLSESEGTAVELPFAGPQCVASAALSSQRSRFVLTMFDSWRVIANATVADGGARQGKARALLQPSCRSLSSRLSVAAEGSSAITGCYTRCIRREAVVASHNNSLEPTPVTKARFVWLSIGAAQLSRSAVT